MLHQARTVNAEIEDACDSLLSDPELDDDSKIRMAEVKHQLRKTLLCIVANVPNGADRNAAIQSIRLARWHSFEGILLDGGY
jgi:hypothetical protein